MPTNADTFNSRVTSEALEKKFRDTFPAQGGAELIQDLYAQGVIVPTIDFSDAALGSVLPQDLQQAWDFATGQVSINGATTAIVANSGFWKVDATVVADFIGAGASSARLEITNGITTKKIWDVDFYIGTGAFFGPVRWEGIVFLRSGDTLQGVSGTAIEFLSVSYRQIADVSGNLVNPLGFVST
jgi:hypothetical protein